MKIVFVDPTPYIFNIGMRTLASVVQALGHDVSIIFIRPETMEEIKSGFPDSVHEALAARVEDADLVGFSFVSNYLVLAEELTATVKRLSIPVVWGGIHAMAKPEESLNHADMVCLGEGEEALAILLKRMERGEDITSTPNFWFKTDDGIVKNEVLPLQEDLDAYPFPMIELEHLLYRDGNRILPMDEDKYKSLVPAFPEYYNLPEGTYYQYMTMTSRGCPHSCAYCCNRLFKDLYRGKGRLLRMRNPEGIVREIELARERFHFFNFVNLFDDDFLARPLQDIQSFATLYRERLGGLPFKCNCSPTSVTREKIQTLVDAGLVCVEMGLQTASERVNKDVYNRKISGNAFMQAATIISQFQQVIPYYDVILDNPFETSAETLETIRFIAQIPTPLRLSWFSLTFYPGTKLHQRALDEGILYDEKTQVYEKKNNALYPDQDPYLKYLITIAPGTAERGWLPRFLFFQIFATRVAVRLFNNRLLHKVPGRFYLFLKKLVGRG